MPLYSKLRKQSFRNCLPISEHAHSDVMGRQVFLERDAIFKRTIFRNDADKPVME